MDTIGPELTFEAVGPCLSGDCECSQHHGKKIKNSALFPPLHDGCTCIAVSDDTLVFSYRTVGVCPLCEKDCSRESLTKLLYTWEQWCESKTLIRQVWHRTCFIEKVIGYA